MNGFIPCLGLLGVLAILFGSLLFIRYLKYKETITLAEKGLPHPEPKTRSRFLRWGILIAGLGIVLSLGPWSLL